MGLLGTRLIPSQYLVQLPHLEATIAELTQLCDSRDRSAGMLASTDPGSLKLAVVKVGMGSEILRDLNARLAVRHVPGHVPTELVGTRCRRPRILSVRPALPDVSDVTCPPAADSTSAPAMTRQTYLQTHPRAGLSSGSLGELRLLGHSELETMLSTQVSLARHRIRYPDSRMRAPSALATQLVRGEVLSNVVLRSGECARTPLKHSNSAAGSGQRNRVAYVSGACTYATKRAGIWGTKPRFKLGISRSTKGNNERRGKEIEN